MSATLAAISIYPVKSCAGVALHSAVVETRGLAGDRRYMLVDETGRFQTGRQLPALVRVQAHIDGPGRLRLAAPGVANLDVAVSFDAARVQANVWGSAVSALDAGDAASQWFSDYLGRQVRLVYADPLMQRPVEPDYAQPGDEVGFADGYPVLLLSRAACEALAIRARRDLGWRRFRPNLLIDGVTAHAEDLWRQIRIGPVLFDVVKPCVRCIFTTIDPDSGGAEIDGEPLRTLKSYRRGAKGITFGQNLIARSTGVLRVGDALEVLQIAE